MGCGHMLWHTCGSQRTACSLLPCEFQGIELRWSWLEVRQHLRPMCILTHNSFFGELFLVQSILPQNSLANQKSLLSN